MAMRPDVKIGLAFGLLVLVVMAVYLILTYNSAGPTGQTGDPSVGRRNTEDRNSGGQQVADASRGNSRETRVRSTTPPVQTPPQTPGQQTPSGSGTDKTKAPSGSEVVEVKLSDPAKPKQDDPKTGGSTPSYLQRPEPAKPVDVKLEDMSKGGLASNTQTPALTPKTVNVPLEDMSTEEGRRKAKALAGVQVGTPGHDAPIDPRLAKTPLSEPPNGGLGKQASPLGPVPFTDPLESGGASRSPLPADPAKSKSAEPAVSSSTSSYTVKSGDTLVRIARAIYGNENYWDVILSANPGIDPSNLRVGKVLVIPALPADKTAKLSPSGGNAGNAVAPAGSRTYTVTAEDNGLADISRKVYGSTKHWPLIQSANPSADTTRLKKGDVLIIPPLPAAKSSGTPSTGGLGAGGLGTGGASQSTDTYTVKEGDNGFNAIARKVYGSEKYSAVIEKANPGVSSTSLKVGQVLKTPKLTETTSGSSAPRSPSRSSMEIDDGQPRGLD